jgi:hypothetical protein
MTQNKQPSPLTFKVKGDERRQIVADAKEAGLSVGSYIRKRLLKEPQTAPTYQRTETRLLIKHLIGHIGRVGNNMNQIAFKLNSDQMLRSVDRAQMEEGIKALRDMRSLLVTHLLHRDPC